MSNKRLYKLTYELSFKSHPQGVEIDESELSANQGAADAMFIGSLIRKEDGGLSSAWIAVDGEELPPRPNEWFFMAMSLLGAIADMGGNSLGEALARKFMEITKSVIHEDKSLGELE